MVTAQRAQRMNDDSRLLINNNDFLHSRVAPWLSWSKDLESPDHFCKEKYKILRTLWNSSHVSHRVMIYGKVGVMRELCRFEASLRERTNTRLTLNSCARRWRPKLLEHCIVCVNDLLSILGTIGQCPSEMNRLDIHDFTNWNVVIPLQKPPISLQSWPAFYVIPYWI